MDALKILPIFGLIAVRLSPFFLSVGLGPLQRIPFTVRLVLMLVLTLALTLLVEPTFEANNNLLVWMFFSEFLVGLSIFFSFQLVFAAFSFWGRVVDMQIGFGAAGIFDPAANTQESLIGSAYIMAATTLFFVLGIHLNVVEILLLSYQAIPLGTDLFYLSPISVSALMTTIFSISLLVIAPIIILLWLLDMFTGFLARTMPQMNIYFVMMPLKIGCGLFLLSIFSRQCLQLFEKIFDYLVSYWSSLFFQG